MDKLYIGVLIGLTIDFISNLLVEPIRRKWRKQCNYDCTKCKVWDCGMHDMHCCIAQQNRELKKRNKIQ